MHCPQRHGLLPPVLWRELQLRLRDQEVLEKNDEVGKLTIKDIRAILISVLGIDEPPNITKPAAVKALEDAIKGDVDALVKIKALRRCGPTIP